MHGHHLFQTRQNETNLLGAGRVPDRHNMASRGLYSPETPQRSGPEHKNDSMGLEADDSPLNFHFLGGQPQMINQQHGMLQSLPRQQSGLSDSHLLQQEAVIRRMQELQRLKQIREQEARHQNSASHISFMEKQAGGDHSPVLINGTPIHDVSNYGWTPELMADNTNWLQRGALPVMQGSSNGLMSSPEQGQVLRMTGLIPHGVDQSLYGFPISSTRGTSTQYSHDNIDKSTMQHLSTCNNSFISHQYAAPDQGCMQDGTSISRQDFDTENLFGHSPRQGLGSRAVTEYSQQVNTQPRIASAQEFRQRQEIDDFSGIFPEKTMMQVASSQSVVPLDPTEEKILFGADDNIWDAFGKTTKCPEGYNLLDGTDFQNAAPSMQSGSWSALMQSAVAEASSGDTGLHDEWSGLTFPNSELPSGSHQPSIFKSSGKQQTVWADSNLKTATSSVSRPFLMSDDANRITNHPTAPGFQQSEIKPFGKSDRFLSMSSARSIQQSSEEGSKWKDCSSLQKRIAEGSEIYGNDVNSSDADLRANSISGSWIHQESTSSYNTGSQPFNKPNGWNFMGTTTSGGDSMVKLSETGNLLQRSQSNDYNRVMHEEMGHAAVTQKGNLVPNSTVELEHGKPDMGTPPINRRDSNLNNVSTVRNLSATKGDQDIKQQFSNNPEYWKHVKEVPSNTKGGENFGKYQHHMNNSLQVLESSVNSSEKGVVQMHDRDNDNKRENSSDSHLSKSSHHVSSGGMRENVWLDANETRSLPRGRHKSSGQIGRNSSGSRKFQYHPMGNLDEDVEPYCGTKIVTLSQATSQLGTRELNSHGQGSPVQSKFVGHALRNSMEMEKERSLESQVDGKGADEVPSGSNFPVYVPNASMGICSPIKTAHSSQNMLELLHKVDQSREHHGMLHVNSSDHTLPSEMPEGETSDRCDGHLQQNHSSAFQGFGLQLAPPSQRLPVPNRTLSSQSSSPAVNSLNLSQATPETGDGSRMWVAPTAMLPARESSQCQIQNNKLDTQGQTNNETSSYSIQGNYSAVFASRFPYSRSQLQNQHMTSLSGQLKTDQSANITFNTVASSYKRIDDSCETAQTGPSVSVSLTETASSRPHNEVVFTADMRNTNQSRVPTQQIPVLDSEPVSEPALKPGMSQQGAFSTALPNAWTNVSTQQRLFGVQSHQASSSLFGSHLQSNNNVETTPSNPQKGGGQDTQRGNGSFESGACSMNYQGFGHGSPTKESPWKQISPDNIDSVQKATSASQGKESVLNHHFDESVPNAAATKRDIEAFGRSLKPNSELHQNYSLLHQMQAMKSIETDPRDRNLKRFKGPDCGLNGEQSSYGFNIRDSSINCSQIQFGDSNMLSVSSEPGDNRDKSQLGNLPSQDMRAYGRNNSPNEYSGNDAVSGKFEQINPRMAPSWFNQFGTFINGKIFPKYDVQKTATLKSMEQPYIIGKSADGLHALSQAEQVDVAADTSQVIDVRQRSTSITIASEHFSSPHSLLPAGTDQSLVVLRPKKRKSATSGLLPWHKEVSQGSQRLLTISMAEVAWAEAANRLIEKVEDEAEMMIDDGPLMLRPKRRLIMTTQLMQQLAHPPPASVLTADSSSNYENVAYFVARSTLGDACSQLSYSGSDSLMLLDIRKLLPEKLRTSNRIGEKHYLKVVEDFIGRAKTLEADLLRLDKKTSILDLRVECQDLEKFSVINRFAKFHGRGQADGVESSSDATMNTQKTFPQRYVTAFPMPRNIPDRVQCFSL